MTKVVAWPSTMLTHCMNGIVTTDVDTDTDVAIDGMYIRVPKYFVYLWLLYSINVCDWESAQNNDDADDAGDATDVFVVKACICSVMVSAVSQLTLSITWKVLSCEITR